MSYFKAVKNMHEKFGVSGGTSPRALSKEEYLFRIGAMFEELGEYIQCVFDIPHDDFMSGDNLRKYFINKLRNLDLTENVSYPEMLSGQLDALVDLVVFTLGTAERQGFQADEAFHRVMMANMEKELSGVKGESKRDFELDLVKPEGWTSPDLLDLCTNPTGIVILEGPDGSGKTTLANHLVEKYGGEYIHVTWNPEIEKNVDQYQLGVLAEAEKMYKDRLVIIDRHWISELIYSAVYRKGTNQPQLSYDCYNILKRLNAIYIMCLPSTPKSKEQYIEAFNSLKDNRKEMYTTMDECVDAYVNFTFGERCGHKAHPNTRHAEIYTKEVIPLDAGFMAQETPVIIYDRFRDHSYNGVTDIMCQILFQNGRK